MDKSCGLDGIYAEHLKYASDKLIPLLSLCFTGMFVHGILPNSLMSVVLVPIIKNKCGSINSKDNYRPIAFAKSCYVKCRFAHVGNTVVYIDSSC